MAAVRALGYLGISVSDAPAWAAFLEGLVDARVEHDGDRHVVATVDDWTHRIIVEQTGSDDVSYVGWQVSDRPTLDRATDRLSAYGVTELTREECRTRAVEGGVWTTDPDGVRTELFHGPSLAPGAAGMRTSFVTGELGLGHVVLRCDDLDRAVEFYVGALGFRLTDTCILEGDEIRFLRCNPRHHSLALAAVAAPRALLHFMLETTDLDSVGQAFSRFAAASYAKTVIGRHSNDHMLSFYGRTPAGFSVEFGAAGRLIHEPAHVPATYLVESAWGHQPFGKEPPQ